MLLKPNRIVRKLGRLNVLFIRFPKEIVGHSGGYINENICSRCKVNKFLGGTVNCGLRGFPDPQPCRKYDTSDYYYIPSYVCYASETL